MNLKKIKIALTLVLAFALFVNVPAQKRTGKKTNAMAVSKKAMKTKGNSSGKPAAESNDSHQCVDLGLPSGVKWATCNVGATKPEEAGYFFAWGDTKTKIEFDQHSCITNQRPDSWLYSQGIIDSNGNLTKKYDAANQNWGDPWRMPTINEVLELIKYTTPSYIVKNGVQGCLLKSKKNGASIFLPFAGMAHRDIYCDYFNDMGYYWSSSVDDSEFDAWSFHIYDPCFERERNIRFTGLLVRPVK